MNLSQTEVLGDDGMVEISTGVVISKEASYLFSDEQLVGLLRSRGIDTTRPTRIKESGRVVYIKKLALVAS